MPGPGMPTKRPSRSKTDNSKTTWPRDYRGRHGGGSDASLSLPVTLHHVRAGRNSWGAISGPLEHRCRDSSASVGLGRSDHRRNEVGMSEPRPPFRAGPLPAEDGSSEVKWLVSLTTYCGKGGWSCFVHGRHRLSVLEVRDLCFRNEKSLLV